MKFHILVFLAAIASISALECSNWAKPVLTPNYTPKGQNLLVADMDTYETGDPLAKKILICGNTSLHDRNRYNYEFYKHLFLICLKPMTLLDLI